MGILDPFRKRQPPKTPVGGSGRFHTNGFLQLDELQQDLVGLAGLRIFDAMYRGDPDIRRNIWMAANPIIGATWSVEPYGGDDAEDKDREAAAFVEWALFEQMSPKFKRHLAEALPVAMRSGFCPFEQIWTTSEYQGKKVLIPKTLSLRLPRSIQRWPQDDAGQLSEVVQFVPQKGYVTIPADDLVYYRFGAEGDNWEGISLLRSAYKPWFLKDKLEKIDAIAQEHQATGIPICYPPAGADDDQLDEIERVLGGIRTAENGYIVAPGPASEHLGPEDAKTGWHFDILSPNASESSDVGKSLSYHSDKIAAAFLVEFMRLGQGPGASGARATARVQENPFLTSVEAIAGEIEDVLNASLIPRMVALNYDVDEPPRLSMSLVDSASITELADYVQKLVASGVLAADPELEDFLRDRADLPPADAEARVARQKAEAEAAKNPPPVGEPGGPPNPPAPAPAKPKPPADPAAPEPAKAPKEEPELEDRVMRWWEEVMELDAINQAIGSAREQFQQAGAAPARGLAIDLANKAIAGRKAPAKPPTELVDAILGELKDLYGTGRATVRRELEAQRRGSVASTNDAAEGGALEELRKRAVLAAQSILSRAWQAVSRAALGSNPDAGAIQAAGEAEANAALRAEAILHAAPALNLGRGDEADAHADEIVGARYTSILDPNRCRHCAGADDDVLRPLDDPVRIRYKPPNPHCEGGNRCRCMEFFQLEAEAPGSGGGGIEPTNPLEPGPGSGAAPSDQFDVSGGSAALRDIVDGQVRTIGTVHSFPGKLPRVPIRIISMRPGYLGRWQGSLDIKRLEVIDESITVSKEALSSEPPMTSVVHEIAHMLDAHGFGDGPSSVATWQAGEYLSSAPALAEWRDAALNSAAFRHLAANADPDADPYLTLTSEVFARSYEQWIALRSGDAILAAKIAARRQGNPDTYWDDEDFRPIAAAFDRFMATRGLRG